MTTDNFINENKTATFKKGDKVVMHTCHESTIEKYKDRVWVCQTDSFLTRGKSEVVFLEDFSGYFAANFLKLTKSNRTIEKLYFKSIDDTTCHSLESHLDDARSEELTEITLVEAIPDNDNPDYIWCIHHEQVTERHDCRKYACSSYSSKSGRGVCKHRGNLYSHGDEVTFKVEQS